MTNIQHRSTFIAIPQSPMTVTQRVASIAAIIIAVVLILFIATFGHVTNITVPFTHGAVSTSTIFDTHGLASAVIIGHTDYEFGIDNSGFWAGTYNY